jgi:large subunit ribosomal protein L13
LKTYQPKTEETVRAWHLVDAQDMILGRLSTEVAVLLRGKHKPTWAPHVDAGDHVVIVNAEKIRITGGSKFTAKRYYRHSGYPGGLRSLTYEQMLEKHPERIVRAAIKGMLPKSRLGRRMLKRLHLYTGAEHKHQAQQPQPYAFRSAKRVEA